MKRFLRSTFALTFGAAVFLTLPRAIAEDLPMLDDPYELRLKVTSTETVREIFDQQAHSSHGAAEGAQVAIVTLEGNARKACRVQFDVGEFAAAFDYVAGVKPDGVF
jgi:hypothetical protein